MASSSKKAFPMTSSEIHSTTTPRHCSQQFRHWAATVGGHATTSLPVDLTKKREFMTNAVDRLWRHAEDTPDNIAVREGDRTWTYRELRDLIGSYAQRLVAADTKPGDRVLLVAPTSQEFVVAYHL